MRHAIPAILAAAWLTATVATAAAADDARLEAATTDAAVSVSDAGRPVLSYRFGGVPFKPYVDKLFTPEGVQILRDAPHDHLHHHALMFALAVDGVDFWAERPDRGKQLGGPPEVSSAGAPRLSLSQRLDWTPPGGKQALAVEDRTIRVLPIAGRTATLLTWQTRLRPGPGREVVALSGTHYDGLGVRFVESMDGVGRFLYDCDEPGPIVRGTERVTPTRWAAYTAPADGRPVTVAMFDHPENARSPAGMFTMLTHFAYLSATPNVWKEPLEVQADRPLTLRYGVALWDGEPGRQAIESLYRRWLELEK